MIDRYERLLDDYEGYLTVELRVSSTTVSDYLREIRQFLAYLHQHETDPLSVDPTGVLQYTAHRADSGLHQRSVGKLITILRSFFHFLAFDELRADDPSSIIELPRVSVTLPDVLTVEEVDTILAAIDTTTHLGIRDRALFELVYSCGLRISEAVQLQIEDLYLDEELIKVTGKGNRERIIPFGAAAGFWLRTYLTAHRVYLLTAGHPTYHLFISRNGTAITRQEPGSSSRSTACSQVSKPRSIRSDTPMRPICCPTGRICGWCRNSSVMQISAPHRSIPTSPLMICERDTPHRCPPSLIRTRQIESSLSLSLYRVDTRVNEGVSASGIPR